MTNNKKLFKKYGSAFLSVFLIVGIMLATTACTQQDEGSGSQAITTTTNSSTGAATDDTTDDVADDTTNSETAGTDDSKATINSSNPETTVKPTASAKPGTVTTTAKPGTTSTTPKPDDGVYMDFRKSGDKNTLGVWWWTVGDVKGTTGEKYLDFCAKNNVSEIYLCIDGMSTTTSGTTYADVRAFVKKAKARGIRVAALTGDYNWIIPTNTGFQNYVDKFNAYQKGSSADEKFYSMHLDVEPHQHPDFKTDRAKVMQWFADFTVTKAVPAAKNAGTILEWDIPFWLTDEVTEFETKKTIVLAELMAKYCETITIMSYRDTANGMYNVSVEEIAFAKQYGCKIVLGAETYSKEGDQVSFMEEGKAVMASELKKLNEKLLKDFSNRNFGIAVHQIKRWYDLKN